MIGCVLNPAGCVSTWFNSIPTETLFIAAFVAGMIAGAILGKRAVAILLTVGAAFLFMRRRRSADDLHEHVGGRDAAPAVKKPRVRRDSIAKRLGIGE